MPDSELVKVVVTGANAERVFPVVQYWNAADCIDHAADYAKGLNRLGIRTTSELVYPDGRNIIAHSWRENV